MQNKIKFLLIILVFLIGILLYWSSIFNNDTKENIKNVTKSNESEKNNVNFNDRKVTEKVTNEINDDGKENVLNYKDLFKEPKSLQNSVDKIVETEALKELDREVDELILEADALIAKEKLFLLHEKNSEETIVEHQNKIDELEKKLEKFITE